jgi:transcriptional regulator with XRE-family HTH domain
VHGIEHIDMRDKIAARIRRAMAARGVGVGDLAQILGLKPRSLSNILNGSAQSRITQQSISNFFNQQFWPDIIVTERIVSLPARCVLILPNEKATADFIREADVKGLYDTSANVVRLLRPTKLHFEIPSPDSGEHPQEHQ